MKKLLSILAAACLAAAQGTAAGEAPALEEKALELAGSSLRFPAVSGLEDQALEETVNSRIREDLRVEEYLQRMTALISDEARSITVSWNGGILGDVFSGRLDAEGAVRTLRSSQVWTWSNVDLRDGHEIALDEVFTDPAAAREALEAYLEEKVAPGLSPHLGNSRLTPLPEGFMLERAGLTLLYDVSQLSTLSDRAGEILVPWKEIRDLLNPEEGSVVPALDRAGDVKIGWNEIREIVDWSGDGIPARIGAAEMAVWTAESPDRIREMAESGQLPDLPVKIGDSVKEWTDRAHLLNDPEEYAGGRMFALEGACFRDIFLLSDAVGSRWDDSRVQGIRMDRGCAWGLCIGETRAETWRRALGEPDSTAVFDEEDADSYRTLPGTCDYYRFGNYRLELQADRDGILISILLEE